VAAGFALGAVATAFYAARWQRAGDGSVRPAPPPRLVLRAVTIAPGIHLLGSSAPSACYAIETKEGLVLVDSGLDPEARSVRADLAALGLEGRRIVAILLTHAHGDHCGGARFLREKTGARVYIGKGDAAVLRAGGPREAFFSAFDMPDPTPAPIPVDVELAGGETLDFGDARVRCLAAPGHTPGSTCYLLERDGLRALFTGDVISMLRGVEASRNRVLHPLGTYSAYLAPRYRGDARSYLETLRELRALPVPDLVLPGHPRSDPSPQRPVVSQDRWEELLDGGIREMQALVARFGRDGANFLDGRPRPLRAGLLYLGKLGEDALYALRAGEAVVLVDAPGGPDLADVVASRLKGLGVDRRPSAVLLTSRGPEATAGLKGLIERFGVEVVTTPATRAGLEDAIPEVTKLVEPEAFAKAHDLTLKAIPLAGRGRSPLAYLVDLGGKAALFSGRIPIKANAASAAALRADLDAAPGLENNYRATLNALAELRPDLWLPAVPVDDQDANLSADDWTDILDANWAAIDDPARR
jgi:metallo-beta-lactamase class B